MFICGGKTNLSWTIKFWLMKQKKLMFVIFYLLIKYYLLSNTKNQD